MKMNKIISMKYLVVASIAVFVVPVPAEEQDYLKAFPDAKEGMSRYVIMLPHKDRKDDGNFKVELIVGKEMITDGVNRVRLGGKIETKPLKGWGFSYYEVTDLGPALSTRMGVTGKSKEVKRFVAGPSTLIGYNSRLPLVVYVPEGAEVHYRIWEAREVQKAPEG